jgi:hypothetical protein
MGGSKESGKEKLQSNATEIARAKFDNRLGRSIEVESRLEL